LHHGSGAAPPTATRVELFMMFSESLKGTLPEEMFAKLSMRAAVHANDHAKHAQHNNTWGVGRERANNAVFVQHNVKK
jgi:hypothetical protein